MPTIEEIRAKAQEKALNQVIEDSKKELSIKLEKALNDLIEQEKTNIGNVTQMIADQVIRELVSKAKEEKNEILLEMKNDSLRVKKLIETERSEIIKEIEILQGETMKMKVAATELKKEKSTLIDLFQSFQFEATKARKTIKANRKESQEIAQTIEEMKQLNTTAENEINKMIDTRIQQARWSLSQVILKVWFAVTVTLTMMLLMGKKELLISLIENMINLFK